MTLGARARRTVTGMGAPAQAGVGVLAVDDQSIFLDVAREVVAATPGFCWVGGANSGEEALDAVTELEPELVLVPLLVGSSGVASASASAGSAPGAPVTPASSRTVWAGEPTAAE